VVGGIIIIGGIYYYLMTQNTIKDNEKKI